MAQQLILPAREWTPEEHEKIKAVSTKAYLDWKTNSTDAEKRRGDEIIESYRTGGQEFRDNSMRKMTEWFAQADSDGDGRLNAAESEVFLNLAMADARSLGNYGKIYDGGIAEYYEILNSVEPSQEGYTKEEYIVAWGPILGYFNQAKAADQ